MTTTIKKNWLKLENDQCFIDHEIKLALTHTRVSIARFRIANRKECPSNLMKF